jgi:nucleotidyltransferase substrate binding protein (TIGR01987 family)
LSEWINSLNSNLILGLAVYNLEENTDIRWKQRFENYQKAFGQLKSAIDENGVNPIDIIKEGIIQRFEFTHELAWKVMKDYLAYEDIQNVTGSRSATKEAFSIGLITNGQVWMDMIESRNKTVHTYNKDVLEREFKKIVMSYFELFERFEQKMSTML